MRCIALIFVLAACGEDLGDVERPSLEGDYTCGPKTCTSGQICIVESSGSQCQVNYDAGVGQYQPYAWTCIDLPAACDGVPSCDCVDTPGICSGPGDDGRELNAGCL
jgi:hypothetical protein